MNSHLSQSEETQNHKPSRKPNVPKLDRVISLVIDGEYDGQLSDLRDAIDQRNEQRKAAVLELVREVYGKDADIATNDQTKPNVFVERAKQQNSESVVHKDVLPGPYRSHPQDGNSMRADGPPDAQGFITITDILGGHHQQISINEWQSWLELDDVDDDKPTPDALSSMDGQIDDMLSETPPGRGGASISGLSASDFA